MDTDHALPSPLSKPAPGPHGEQTAAWLRAGAPPDGQGERLHVDGASVDVGDTRFTVCPWWDGPTTRDEVGEQLAASAVDRPARSPAVVRLKIT